MASASPRSESESACVEAVAGTDTAFAEPSLQGHFEGSDGFSTGAFSPEPCDFRSPQQFFRPDFSETGCERVAVPDACPSRAAVQQQSIGPTSSNITKW